MRHVLGMWDVDLCVLHPAIEHSRPMHVIRQHGKGSVRSCPSELTVKVSSLAEEVCDPLSAVRCPLHRALFRQGINITGGTTSLSGILHYGQLVFLR